MQIARNEKRTSVRVSRSEELMWRCVGRGKTEIGLLLEASEHGMAFAWRGSAPLQAGTLIEVLGGEPEEIGQRKRVVVRRFSPCHDNLSVVGVEIVDFRPFPTRYMTRATAPWEREEAEMMSTIRPALSATNEVISSRLPWAG